MQCVGDIAVNVNIRSHALQISTDLFYNSANKNFNSDDDLTNHGILPTFSLKLKYIDSVNWCIIFLVLFASSSESLTLPWSC